VFVSAVRLRVSGEPSFRVWRLTPGLGTLRGFSVVDCAPGDFALMTGGLSWLAGHGTSGSLEEVALQIADGAGESWVLQRKLNQLPETGATLTIWRNGKALEEEQRTAITSLLSALAEGDLGPWLQGPLQSERPETALVQVRQLNWTTWGLTANVPGEADSIEDTAQSLASTCSAATGATTLADPRVLARLATRLEPLLAKIADVQIHLKELDRPLQEQPETAATLESLSQELSLINRLEETAAPLLDPAQSVTILRESLDRAERRLTEGLAALGLTSLPNPQSIRDWQKPLKVLARLEAMRPLVVETAERMRIAREILDPAWQDWFGLLDKTLQRDGELSQRVEQALTVFSIKQSNTAASKAEGPERSVNTSWFDRVRTKFASIDRGERSEPAIDPVFNSATMEAVHAARHAAAEMINRLATMRGGLTSIREEQASARARLEDLHEKLLEEHGRLESKWQEICSKSCIAPDTTLSQLCTIVQSWAELSSLVEERDSCLAKLAQRRTQLGRIAELVSAWRSQTGSQKAADLDNPQILLSEARQIIRWRAEKEKLLTRVRAGAEHKEVRAVAREIIESRRKTLFADWKKAFAEAKAPLIRPSDPKIEHIIKEGRLARAALEIGRRRVKPVQNLLQPKSGDAPLAFWIWSPQAGEPARKKMLEALKMSGGGTSSAPMGILITTDKKLADSLQGEGCGKASRVAVAISPATQAATPAAAVTAPSRTGNAGITGIQPAAMLRSSAPGKSSVPTSLDIRPGQTTAAEQTQGTRKPLISARAQAALETLTGLRPK
jgi:hypothetical protein